MVTKSEYHASEKLSTSILSSEQLEYGFMLSQTDDHIVTLTHEGKPVSHFNASIVDKETIQDVANDLMRGYRLKGHQVGVFEAINKMDGNVTLGDLFHPTFNQEYELALRIGNERFGSECKHTETKDGVCLQCFRKVI